MVIRPQNRAGIGQLIAITKKGGEQMIPQEPEATNPEVKEGAVPETKQDLQKMLAESKQKADDYLDSWKRAQADFINYKRRADQEKMEMGVYANTQLILSLLPVLDDFERAVDSLTPKLAKVDWVHGIRLVERKLRTTLEAQGMSPIKALGEDFDPNLHEAVMHVKGEDGKVVRELQKGYRLHDKILRPSKVAVGNGEPVIEEPAIEPEEETKQE
jgi:molecular chaperone GrpE